MDYDRPTSRVRGRLVASRQKFFETACTPQDIRNQRPITSLVDEKLENFTRSAQEASLSLAKSTPDLSALEQDANKRVTLNISKSRQNLNQTFDTALIYSSPREEVRPVSPIRSTFGSLFTSKKPPLPPKKVLPPTVVNKENTSPNSKVSEFDKIVNSIKSTDTYRRYKKHSSVTQPDMRRRSKSLGFLELDEDENWVLPVKPQVEPVFPQLSERSASTTLLTKKAPSSSENTDDDDDVPFPCNRLSTAKSEYELRIEKSLKNLNLPDWYTKSSRPSSRASILSGRGTPAMSSERFSRNRLDYESFRSLNNSGHTVPPKREPPSRITTPSWRSFSSQRRSPPTPNSETEHQNMEKTQNWINSQQTEETQQSQTQTTTSTPYRETYTGWRKSKDPNMSLETDFSTTSFEEKRMGSERYSFVQAVNNSIISEDKSFMETSFDSSPSETFHNKVWLESSLISRPVNGFQQTDYQENFKKPVYPGYGSAPYGMYEKRQQRHPDAIYNKAEAPPRPTGRHPFNGGILEAVV